MKTPMKIIVCAFAAFLIALGLSAKAAAEIGQYDPPGWYLEGPGMRAGPFGSAGLCMDLRNRQGAAGAQCVQYDRFYWLVADAPGGPAAVTNAPFATLQACLEARVRVPANGRNLTCSRRTPNSRPLPGTASVPGASVVAATRS